MERLTLRGHIDNIVEENGVESYGEGIESSIRIVSRNLERCLKENNFKEISLSNAKSIIEQAGEMKVSTAKKLMELFWESYGPESAVLLGYINCEDSGADCFDVIRPLKECPLLQQMVDTADDAVGCRLIVDAVMKELESIRAEVRRGEEWKDYYEEEKHKNSELKSRNVQLKRQLESAASGRAISPGIYKIKVYVKTLTGKRFKMYVNPEETVEHFKEKIFKIEGIPVDQQRAIFSGKQLEDGNTLADYGIRYKDTIMLVLRLRG